MPEQELKLHVPAASRRRTARDQAARSHPHPPACHVLRYARARAGAGAHRDPPAAGRPRLGETLKMPGADAITRIEMNHPRPGPVLDLSVYAGTDVEAPLAAIKGELGLRYETDVLLPAAACARATAWSSWPMTLASCAPARWNCPYPNWNSNWCRASRAPSSPLPEAGNSATRWCWTRAASPSAATRWRSWRTNWQRSTPPPATTIRRAAPRPSPGSGATRRGRDRCART